MSIEPAPKVFLQNKLRRCREKLNELTPLMDSKRGFANMSSIWNNSDIGHIHQGLN